MQKVKGELARVRADYRSGDLTAAEWREFRDELTGELEAASAKADRLCEQERSIESGASLRDAEEEMLRHLAEVRAAIAAEVAAGTVESVRAALAKLFDHFTVHPTGTVDLDALLDEQPFTEPSGLTGT